MSEHYVNTTAIDDLLDDWANARAELPLFARNAEVAMKAEALATIIDDPLAACEAAMARARGDLGDDGQPAAHETPRIYALADLANLWAVEAEEAREACLENRVRGPVTGFPTIDHELGGYLRPGLHVLHGEPGCGKTNFALQVAASCGAPALFVTTEMSVLALLRRIVARITDTYQGKLDGGELSPETMLELFERAVAACPMLAILDGTRHFAPALGILEAAAGLRDRFEATSVLVAIDSLHTWAAAAPRAEKVAEYEFLNAALSSLEHVASELQAPVLIIAERNRANMDNPGQSSAKGSGRFEYAAHTIVSLNKKKSGGAWQQDASGEYEVVAQLVKNRDGSTGPKINMFFNGALARLREA